MIREVRKYKEVDEYIKNAPEEEEWEPMCQHPGPGEGPIMPY